MTVRWYGPLVLACLLGCEASPLGPSSTPRSGQTLQDFESLVGTRWQGRLEAVWGETLDVTSMKFDWSGNGPEGNAPARGTGYIDGKHSYLCPPELCCSPCSMPRQFIMGGPSGAARWRTAYLDGNVLDIDTDRGALHLTRR
jgi:hypothetical protein